MAKETFRQNTMEEADFSHVYYMHLLFREEGERLMAETLQEELEKRYGRTDLVTDADHKLTSFALFRYLVEYKDEEKIPAQVMMMDYQPFDQERIDAFQRSQFWDCPQSGQILDKCRYELILADFLAAGLPYTERCDMLAGWLDLVLRLLPECEAVWFPASGKLLTREQLLENPYEDGLRFIYFGVNARFFTIDGSEDCVVDTLGLYAIGLPDVQYHYHGLDPNRVVNHAYNTAIYIFENHAPIKSGETIDGISENGIDRSQQWKCQYERALIQPVRDVMDICAGEYASGGRN